MIFLEKKTNKYDWIIFIMVLSLMFGAAGGFMQPARALGILFLPLLFNNIRGARKYVNSSLNWIQYFMLYAFLSLLWSLDVEEGLKEFVYFIVHFSIYFEIVVFSFYAKRPLKSIALGWMIAVICTLGIATWEFSTNQHLPYSKYEDVVFLHEAGALISRQYAAATFVNFNTYTVFLCVGIPFIIYLLAPGEKGLLPIFTVLGATVVILLNASRGGFLSIVMIAVAFILANSRNKIKMISLLLMIVGLVAVLVIYFTDILYFLSIRASDGNLMESEGRMEIWRDAMKAFGNSYGFGVGIGSMKASMHTVTNGILITHNLFIEILLQYGFIFFVVFVVYLYKNLLASIKSKDVKIKATIFPLFMAMPFYTIINSGYLLEPMLFVLLASITVFAHKDDFRLESFTTIKRYYAKMKR